MLVVVENVLTKKEVAAYRSQLDGATWCDGQTTAGTLSAVVKSNQQLSETDETAIRLGHEILRRLGSHPLFISAALPERIYPPKFNRYSDGGHYGIHVDSAVMRIEHANLTLRSDLSATLFLCEPDEYDGGELTIEGEFGAQSVKLPAGDMILYPSSSLHQVLPVTKGARVSSFFWIQSMVQDSGKRETLFDLDQSIQSLTAKNGANDEDVVQLSGVYHNLLRRWAIV